MDLTFKVPLQCCSLQHRALLPSPVTPTIEWERLEISSGELEKRREVKGKGEKEKYILLNAEFQRIARRHNKAFLSDQCKEIEENKRMGKTRDLFKKIRDTKGTFHAKMGTIENGNGMDLTEPKKKHYPVMDVTGDRRKVRCCKE